MEKELSKDLKLKRRLPSLSDNKDLPVTITVRVSSDERKKLESDAVASGMNISQHVRFILFRSSGGNGANLSANDAVHATLIAAKKVRADFKKIVPFYISAVEEFNRLAASCSTREDVTKAATRIGRALQGVEVMTLDLQKSLNEFLDFTKTKEVHDIAKMAITKPDQVSDKSNSAINNNHITTNKDNNTASIIVKYSYMQRIELMGTIYDDAKETKNERISFVIIVKSVTKSNIEKKTLYRVFADKDSSLPLLTKDKQVFVCGELTVNFKEKDGNTSVDLIVSADTIKIFGLQSK